MQQQQERLWAQAAQSPRGGGGASSSAAGPPRRSLGRQGSRELPGTRATSLPATSSGRQGGGRGDENMSIQVELPNGARTRVPVAAFHLRKGKKSEYFYNFRS